jgi:hypothetical protein
MRIKTHLESIFMVRQPQRRMMAMMSIAAAALLAAGVAEASGYTGPVLDVRTNSSQYTPGNIRVSIQTNTTTSCNGFGWYSYDMPDASVGKVWTAILLAAIHGGRSVAIGGTGTCDPVGYEIVYYIDAL